MSSSTPPIADSAARERIRSALDESLMVEAAAGTGKTTMLVERLVALLGSGRASVDGVVAVTFTRKAAGELKLRLRQELDKARKATDDEDRRRCLEDALARLEEARIGTIHAFCADVLRERPVEALVDPAFREVDEEDGARLYNRAFRRWIERRLDDPPEGLRRALGRLANERTVDGSSPIDRLRDAGRGLIDWRDFPGVWERRPFERAAAIDDLVRQVRTVASIAAKGSNSRDYLKRALEPVGSLASWILRSEEAGERDYDALEAQLVVLLRGLRRNLGWKGRGRWFAPGIPREEALAAREGLIESLDDFKRRADADLAALLHVELGEVVERYEDLKRASGALDFLDLLVCTRDLVRDNAAVRRHLQKRFTHLFVDEFQDTDPLQAEILLLLAADDPEQSDWRTARPKPGKIFLVGDPKQSIYRFRRADVVLYEGIKERLQGAGVGLVHLSCSFRAVRPLQQMVNAAFAPEMTGERELGQANYVPLDAFRPRIADQPDLVVLPVPKPYQWSYVTGRAIEASLPEAAAAWIQWLIEESGWTIEDQETRRRRAVRAGDVALLFRRFVSWRQDMTRPYVRALEARGIPHLLVGGRSFHEREEVETLRAALTAIEWPDDELAVFAALRGSLFAVDDALLLRFRHESGSLHPFRPLPDDLSEVFAPIREALALLRDLHKQRNQVPIVDSVLELLRFTRAHAGFALRPAGNQVLVNVQYVCDLARRFEVRGGLSFRGFVERLEEESQRLGSGQSPVLEEGADGVRMMTAHAAKGLEFPVVLLADITARLTSFEPSLFVDTESGLCAQKILGCSPWELLEHQEIEAARDHSEGVRLAYVAATRARDLLVVPGVGDQPFEGGWASPLDRALYPATNDYRKSEPAPGCPEFGESSVLERPQQHDGEPERSVRPGLHRPEAGDHQVVWWDPAVLGLDVPGLWGLREEHLLAPVDDDEGLERWFDWRSRRRDACEDGGEASLDVVAVTQTEDPPPGESPEIVIERVSDRAAGRAAGARFGTLVHTVLRDVDYDASREQIDSLVRLHGRMLDARDGEVEAAGEAVEGALAHPLVRRAAVAEEQHREVPFLLSTGSRGRVEGTIDLLFRDDEGWIVIDFKTDVVLEDPGPYERQLAWYLHAVEKMLGERARGILLSV